jgi:hypothetical protein
MISEDQLNNLGSCHHVAIDLIGVDLPSGRCSSLAHCYRTLGRCNRVCYTLCVVIATVAEVRWAYLRISTVKNFATQQDVPRAPAALLGN